MARDIESQIDDLYQGPLGEFTSRRATLAKDLRGEARSRILALGKPSVPAWAVNQLYWQARPSYDALVKAAEHLRAAHRSVIGGRKADLRKPGEVHDAAVDQAFRDSLAILTRTKVPASPATKNSILQTLRALPVHGDRAGRLVRPLEPSGFEFLTGVKPRPASLRLVGKAEAPSAASAKASSAAAKRRGAAEERAKAKEHERARIQARKAASRAKQAAADVRSAATRLAAAQADEARQRHLLDRAIQVRVGRERELSDLQRTAEAAAAAVKAGDPS
jgi:hypothetical protein